MLMQQLIGYARQNKWMPRLMAFGRWRASRESPEAQLVTGGPRRKKKWPGRIACGVSIHDSSATFKFQPGVPARFGPSRIAESSIS
jgi:hypothetical protein